MISGKIFADYCKWVIDPRYPTRNVFSYGHANDGDWVFINGDYVHMFCQRVPSLRTKRFYFIIHNTDRSFGEYELGVFLPYAYHIYAINTVVRHPSLTTIPIGFVDKQLDLLPQFKGGSTTRDIDVYVNFLDHTNAHKRSACRRAIANTPNITYASGLSVPDYFRDIGRSKFVICPEGTGLDTHRVYESLFCGATPVVLHSPLDNLYERLPVCIVSNWTDPYTVPEGRTFSTDILTYLQPLPHLTKSANNLG